MHTSSKIPTVSRTRRIAILLLAALLWTGAPLHAGPIGSAIYLVKGLVGLPFQVVEAGAKAISKGVSKKSTKQATKN